MEANADKVQLAKLDTYRNKKTAATYNVKSIPTVLLFKDGEVKGRIDGQFAAYQVEELIRSL